MVGEVKLAYLQTVTSKRYTVASTPFRVDLVRLSSEKQKSREFKQKDFNAGTYLEEWQKGRRRPLLGLRGANSFQGLEKLQELQETADNGHGTKMVLNRKYLWVTTKSHLCHSLGLCLLLPGTTLCDFCSCSVFQISHHSCILDALTFGGLADSGGTAPLRIS